MTNKEAIADLMLAQADVSYRPKDDSIDMAIKALENQTVIFELEKIKSEILFSDIMNNRAYITYWKALNHCCEIVDKHISELKGE